MLIDCIDIRWDEYIKRLPVEKRDIYYSREYCQMEEHQEGGRAQLFVYEEENDIAVYPFIKNEIYRDYLEKIYYDIRTPYGYGGPVSSTEDEAFIQCFEANFLEYCQKSDIIAEFIRFHPLIQNEYLFRNNIDILHNRSTVWLDLTQDIDKIWINEVSRQNRNTIRKCEKNQLTVSVSDDYDEFVAIYNATMEKVSADDFYYFDEDYYNQIRNSDKYVLLCVKQGEEILAMAIFMGYGDYFHYHLAGSKKESLHLSPNNILLWEAIKYGKEHGYKKMHFGGGLTDSMEDNLFRFKSKYSKTYTDFYIGKRVHNQEVYDKLIDEWEREHNKKAFLLLHYSEK